MTTDQLIIYSYLKQIPLAANRREARAMKSERERILSKLEAIHNDFVHLITNHDVDYNRLFLTYNQKWQDAVDWLAPKCQFFAIHRGWFYTMFQPEKIGVMRHEEMGRTNALSNITTQTIAETILCAPLNTEEQK